MTILNRCFKVKIDSKEFELSLDGLEELGTPLADQFTTPIWDGIPYGVTN